MSRTIRRKNVGNWDKQWYVEDLERVDGEFRWEWVKKTGKALKKAHAKYHSDATQTMQHVPKHFRQESIQLMPLVDGGNLYTIITQALEERYGQNGRNVPSRAQFRVSLADGAIFQAFWKIV